MSLHGAGSSKPRIIDAGLGRFEMVQVERDDEEIIISEMHFKRSDEPRAWDYRSIPVV
jgi:hypothetical protein